MTQHFHPSGLTIVFRDDNNNVMSFTKLEVTEYENAVGDINTDPCCVVVLITNEKHKKGFECTLFEKYSNVEEFISANKTLLEDSSNLVYVKYGNSTEIDFVFHALNDLKEYVNQ